MRNARSQQLAYTPVVPWEYARVPWASSLLRLNRSSFAFRDRVVHQCIDDHIDGEAPRTGAERIAGLVGPIRLGSQSAALRWQGPKRRCES
jgi:hypothetical protein